VRAGRLGDARHAATEALDRLEPEGRVIASIAARAVLLAAGDSDDAGVLAAHRTAWRADPRLDRLLGLVDVATAVGELDDVLTTEAERTDGEPIARRPDLATGLLLLAGCTDDAVRLVDATDVLGWDGDRDPAAVVVPFLLVAASNANQDQSWGDSLPLELLDRANDTGWLYDRLPDDGLETLRATLADQAPQAADRYRATRNDDLLLSTLLTRPPRASPAVSTRASTLAVDRPQAGRRAHRRGRRRPAPCRLRPRSPPRGGLRRSDQAHDRSARRQLLPRRPADPLSPPHPLPPRAPDHRRPVPAARMTRTHRSGERSGSPGVLRLVVVASEDRGELLGGRAIPRRDRMGVDVDRGRGPSMVEPLRHGRQRHPSRQHLGGHEMTQIM
jgi:hypothetical protein